MIGTITEYEERYDREITDETLSKEWKRFGDIKYVSAKNRRAYEKWLECGYEGEPEFNEYGWLINNIRLKPTEILPLWEGSSVECAQLPNGKWVSGSHCHWSLGGYFCSVSIWGDQYDSRVTALTSELRLILRQLKEKPSAEKERIAIVVKAMDDIRQLSLF